jgi:hypothetical protein
MFGYGGIIIVNSYVACLLFLLHEIAK